MGVSATTTSGDDLIASALRKIKVLGADQNAPDGEDGLIALGVLNEILGEWNAVRRFATFIRTQEWAFGTARASYTIGASADSPNFAVTTGGPPVEIESAAIVNTDGATPVDQPCAVWTQSQYQAQVSMPTMTGSFPLGIYYQPSQPLGVIYPWPAYPSFTSYKLQLSWPDQLLELTVANKATAIRMSPGYKRALSLTLARALTLEFGVNAAIIQELKIQQSAAISAIQLNNRPPATISTDGGLNSARGWNWLTMRPG